MANASDVGDAGFDFTKEDDALKALQDRGVSDASGLLQHATPEAIVAACLEWDKQKGVGKGLLVRWVRDGGVQSPPERQSSGQRLRVAFADYVVEHPLGSVAMPHSFLQRLRGDLDPVGGHRDYPGDDPCDGGMVVIGVQYPILEFECDKCGLELAAPVGQLRRMPK